MRINPFLSFKNKIHLISITKFCIYIENLINSDFGRFNIFNLGDNKVLSVKELSIICSKNIRGPILKIYCPKIIINFFLILIGKKTWYETLSRDFELDCSKIQNYLGEKDPIDSYIDLQKLINDS